MTAMSAVAAAPVAAASAVAGAPAAAATVAAHGSAMSDGVQVGGWRWLEAVGIPAKMFASGPPRMVVTDGETGDKCMS